MGAIAVRRVLCLFAHAERDFPFGVERKRDRLKFRAFVGSVAIRLVCRFTTLAPVIRARFELEHLMARGGFEAVEIYGDFERGPVTPESRDFVVVGGLARGG